ncbi:MAG: GNAT family N-acetyltransferase, partial [Clostridia bacterium]|nr:GNAT family N-acetyltransferase [Clostridia bacterium]
SGGLSLGQKAPEKQYVPQEGDDFELCAAVTRNGVVVCLAEINDFCEEGDGNLEISVETVKDARGKGFATSAVRLLSDELVRRGYTVHYVTKEANVPSAALAAWCGFVLSKRERSFVFFGKEESHGV